LLAQAAVLLGQAPATVGEPVDALDESVQLRDGVRLIHIGTIGRRQGGGQDKIARPAGAGDQRRMNPRQPCASSGGDSQ